jgi:hypothetical protein
VPVEASVAATLLADEARLSDSGDAEAAVGDPDRLEGGREGRAEVLDLPPDGVRLDLEDPPRDVEAHGVGILAVGVSTGRRREPDAARAA